MSLKYWKCTVICIYVNLFKASLSYLKYFYKNLAMYLKFIELLKITILSLSFQISPLGAVNDHRWLIRRTGNLLHPTSPTPISNWIGHNQTWFLCSDILILLWALNTDNLTLSCLIGFVSAWGVWVWHIWEESCQCMCRERERVCVGGCLQTTFDWVGALGVLHWGSTR